MWLCRSSGRRCRGQPAYATYIGAKVAQQFCLTIHHLWGRTLDKHNHDACAVAYADDGYIKAKLSVALEVLSDIKLVLKEDAGLDINDKIVKGITAAEAHAAAQRLLNAHPSLAHLDPLLTPKAFVDNGYIGLGGSHGH